MKRLFSVCIIVGASIHAGEVEDYYKKLDKAYATAVEKADRKLEEAKKQREKEVGEIIKKYVAGLKKVMNGYTRAANLDKALAVKKEIEEIEKLLKANKKTVAVKEKDKDEKPDTVDVEKVLGYKLKWHPMGAKKGPNGHYYLFVKGFMAWQSAYDRAKAMGGHLATVTTKAEYDFLCKLEKPGAGNDKGGIWLGGKNDGSISWITGEKVDGNVPVHKMVARYDRISIRVIDGVAKLAGQLSNGRNGGGLPLVKGFFVEWVK